MKIYGGRDYYDSMLAYGVDPAIVLQRDPDISFSPEEIPQKVEILDIRYDGKTIWDVEAKWVIVYFCSKIYRGLKISLAGEDLYFWNVDKFKKWAEDNKIKIRVLNRWNDIRKGLNLENCMDVIEANDNLKDFMIANRIAIMLGTLDRHGFGERRIPVNPSGLKKIGFAKAVPPYTAYQELSMWVGGVLGGQSPETVTITDDKVLVENHGFDKHSFRSSERT